MHKTLRYSILSIFLLPIVVFSQVTESVVYPTAMPRPASVAYKAAGDTITLPISDDFSRKSTFPNPAIWADRNVFLSTTIPQNLKSIGAAVFDGTNEFGFPYNINRNGSDTIADYLTSHYIRFNNPPNNLMLSFLYQRGGFGEVPEVEDSLVVEFWSPIDTAWQQVWGAKGTGGATNFLAATVPVDSAKWLVNGFRFRLGAYGARNGVFDIWNVDYVELDANRNAGDTIVNEPAFVRQHPFLTDQFTHIPWFHYNDNQILPTVTCTYRRNGPVPSGGWALNLGKYFIEKDGTQIKDRLNVPVITVLNHDVDLDFSVPIQPISSTPINGEFEFFMRTWFDGTAEGLRGNDTIEVTIPFKNFYGFDDGTAERAYGLANQTNARLAIQFQPIQPDTLRGLMINFAHGGEDATDNSFQIAVWSAANNEPGQILYLSDSVYTPQYGYYHNDFMPFELDEPFYIPGAVYIGIIQKKVEPIHMGLDINTPNATPKFYGNGFTWYQSLVPGTVMLRPYMRYTPNNIGLAEVEQLEIKVYPNPAQHTLRVEMPEDANWVFLNATGQVVVSGNEAEINVSSLPRGLYILQVNKGGKAHSFKIMLQ